MTASSFFGDDLDNALAMNRERVTSQLAGSGGKIWPNTSEQYGPITEVGTRIEGQIVDIVRDYWPSGDDRVKIILRNADGYDFNITLDKFTMPVLDETPGTAAGDYAAFEVFSVRPKKSGVGWYVNLNMALKKGPGKVTIEPAIAPPPAPTEDDWGDPPPDVDYGF